MDSWIYELDKIDTPIWTKYKNKKIYLNKSFNLNIELEMIQQLIEDESIGYKGPITLQEKSYNKLGMKISKDNIYIGVLIPTLDIEKCKNASCMFNLLIDSIPEIIFCKDINLNYTIVNKECEKFYNDRGVYNLIGKTDLEFDMNKQFINTCRENDKVVMNNKKALYIEEKVPIPNSDEFAIYQTIKTPIIDKYGNLHGLIGSVRDISQQKKIEDKLRYLSYRDILTGLYNRTYFDEKITEIKKCEKFKLGLVIGDINGLKKVNDTLGHIDGDKFIKKIADILARCCGSNDLVFRWGGDEFITLLFDANEDKCKKYIYDVNNACENERYKKFKISISQGYAIFDENQDIDSIIRQADYMLYKNKDLNKK
ncbi:MAG: diguanylate cyclase [Peptostreptococcaceae bacterium]